MLHRNELTMFQPMNSSLQNLVFVGIVFIATGAFAADKPLRIVNVPQLFADDLFVEEASNVRRVAHRAQTLNGGKPIFTGGRFYGTVLHDQGKFKMWWRHDDLSGYSYAESADGLHFETKAKVSGINFAGDVNLAVEIDPRAPNSNARFIAGYDAPGMAAGIVVSADGIKWTPLNDGKRVTHRAADTYNQIIWDPTAQHYKLFTRTDFGSGGGKGEVRGHRVMTNPDIHKDPTNWTTQKEWIFDRQGEAEKQRRQIYTLTDWVYYQQHFALMSVYEHIDDFSEGPQNKQQRHDKDIMNVYLGTSRDGMNWDFKAVYDGHPLVERGGNGAFDNGMVIAASSVVTHANKHWIYYCGWNERHGNPEVKLERDSAIGVATIRLEGFYSLNAGAREGVITTRPFTVEGSEMLLNVAASKGVIQAELCDLNNRPLPGYSGDNAAVVRKVDSVRTKVVWSRPLEQLEGKVVKLKLTMRNAELYAVLIQP